MLFRELIVDNFAGGGGASTGIELAIGRSVDIAINHDQAAIDMHKMNHPDTKHFCEDVWEIDPRQVTNGLPVGLCWLSPDCKHFSKAKGGAPVNKNIRGLAWVAVRWAATVKPRVIMLENVEEFKTWGPLVNGEPCKKRKGQTFQSFVRALERQGYQVQTKELRACDYGAPTIRKRLFLIARRDGQKIIWPKPTHGDPKSEQVKKGKLLPWRTAAECIDFSLPCPSIFERKKPLAENTMRRIAKGIERFVINANEPFIVTCNHGGTGFRGQSVNDPMLTLTASRDAHGLVVPKLAPFITEHANSSSQRNMPISQPLRTICAQPAGGHFAVVAPVIARQFGKSVGHSVTEPLGTVTAGGGGKSQLVAAFIAKHYTGVTGVELTEPMPTVTTIDHNALVTSHIIKLRGTNTGHQVDEPMHTVTAGGNHLGEVRASLVKYYGTLNHGCSLNEPLHTVRTSDCFGLLNVKFIKPPLSDEQLYQAWWCARFMDDYLPHPTQRITTPQPRKSFIAVHGGILVDILMRMLQPHELFAAQGFPADYIIDHDADGKKTTKANQVARCGNSVCPPLAQALVEANLPEMALNRRAA